MNIMKERQTMRKYVPKKTALTIIKLGIISLCVLLTVAAKIYLSSFRILMIVLICLFWSIGILFAFLILPGYFHRTVIYTSGTEISIHTGMIFKRREFMKMSAVQYVTKLSFPLSGFSGFNFILVRGLGGTIILPFLRITDCDDIINLIHAKITDRTA